MFNFDLLNRPQVLHITKLLYDIYHIGDVMVSVLTLSAVDHGFKGPVGSNQRL